MYRFQGANGTGVKYLFFFLILFKGAILFFRPPVIPLIMGPYKIFLYMVEIVPMERQ